MRNPSIQTAIDTIIREMKVLEENANCTGTDNWHARYLQAQKDKDRLACTITELESKNQDLTNALQGREETLKGWQTSHAGILNDKTQLQTKYNDALQKANQFANERDEWARRFKALDADMRGTMVTLEQEREQVKLLKKSNQHIGLVNDELQRELDAYKKTDAYRSDQIKQLMKANAYLHDKNDELRYDVQSGKDTIACLDMDIERLHNFDRDRQEAHNEMDAKVKAFEFVIAHLTQKGEK